MKTNTKKKGRIAIAWLVIVTMVFATMYTPFAMAETTLDVHGITKVGAQTQYVIPAENDFVFIKQATADKNTYVLWTRDTLTVAEQHLIIDSLLKNLPGGDKSIFDLYVDKKDPSKGVQYNLVQYFSGFKTINIIPKTGAPYSYTFSQNDAGQIILDNNAKKISHIYYGQYDESYFISVNKAVTLNESSDPEDLQGINGSIFVSLYTKYENGEYSGLIGQKEIKVKDGASIAPAVFEVAKTGTYYVVETYANGDPVEPGMMFGKKLVSIDNSAPDGIIITTTSKNDVLITNHLSFEEPKGTGTIEVEKILNGKSLSEDMFEFQLIEVESDFTTPVLGGVNETVGNEAALDGMPGKVQFSTIEYENDNTHYYLIKEKKGNDPTITYDNSEIKVTMNLTDDGEGNLIGTPTYSDGIKTFTNTYTQKEYGQISVTKEVVISDGSDTTINGKFYAGLFVKGEGDSFELVSLGEYEEPAIVELEVVNNESAPVLFEGLDLGMTYYVFETDKEGMIIDVDDEGNILPLRASGWYAVKYDKNVIPLDTKMKTGAATISNFFSSDEGELLGSILVTKTVTVNNKPFASNRTFHVGLFADEELTTLIAEKSLTPAGKYEASFDALEAGATFYVAETDGKGIALTKEAAKELGFDITINDKKVEKVAVVIEGDMLVELVNNFKSEEFPLTGDDSNMNLWLFLGMLGVAGALAPFAFRKKEATND